MRIAQGKWFWLGVLLVLMFGGEVRGQDESSNWLLVGLRLPTTPLDTDYIREKNENFTDVYVDHELIVLTKDANNRIFKWGGLRGSSILWNGLPNDFNSEKISKISISDRIAGIMEKDGYLRLFSEDKLVFGEALYVKDFTINGSSIIIINLDGHLEEYSYSTEYEPQKYEINHSDKFVSLSEASHGLFAAINKDGKCYFWTASSSEAIEVEGFDNIKKIDIKDHRTAGLFSRSPQITGLRNDGTVITAYLTPYGNISIKDLPEEFSNAVDVASGYAISVALKEDGEAVMWSRNLEDVKRVQNIKRITADARYVYLLDYSGKLIIQEIDGFRSYLSKSQEVPLGVKNIRKIIGHGRRAFTVVEDLEGKVYYWGGISTGLKSSLDSLVRVDTLKKVLFGEDCVLALSKSGNILVKGDNQFQPASNIGRIKDVEVSSNRIVALLEDGRIYGWGESNFLSEESSFIDVATGPHATIGVKADGSLATWGNINITNEFSDIISVSMNRYMALIMHQDSSVTRVGYNDINTFISHHDVKAKKIVAGSTYAYVLESNGKIYMPDRYPDFDVRVASVAGVSDIFASSGIGGDLMLIGSLFPTISSNSKHSILIDDTVTIKVVFPQRVVDFHIDSISVENAVLSNLQTEDSITFTAKLFASSRKSSFAKVLIEQNKCQYKEGGSTMASNEFRRLFRRNNHLIKGRLYSDFNRNCRFDSTDLPLEGYFVTTDGEKNYARTNSEGFYELSVNGYQYDLSVVPPSAEGILIEKDCVVEYKVEFDSTTRTIDSLDFPLQITECSILSVDVSSNRRRRCFENQTILTYQNTGVIDSEEAKVYLKLPEYVDLVSVDSSFTLTEDSVYVFDVGILRPGDFGTINITDIVRCESGITGLDQCTEAWITPVNTCLASNDSSITDWDESNLEIEGYCVSKTEGVRFVIKNTGEGDMADSSTYRIYENTELASSNRFKLAGGDSLVIQANPFLGALRLEADQTEGNPNSNIPNKTVTGCANGVAYRISTANFFEQDDASLQIEVDCLPIIDSFDPNDKMATPQGITENRYVKPDTRLEYRIRFQNTGTDTAYTVVVVDTLSPLMDISTFRMGSTSHNYDLQVSGEGSPVLTWTFNDIDLPDSTENEPESHGFIKFGIAPFAGYPDGTIVRNEANIYFDFNEPILTNDAWVNYYDTVLVTPSYQFGEDLDLPIPTFAGLEEYTNKPFTAEVNMNENVILEIQDLTLSNATVSELQGAEKSYTMLISPIADGEVSIQIPEKSFADLAGNGNLQSNKAKTIYDITLPTFDWIYSEEKPFEVVFEPSEITTGTISLSDLEIIGATAKSLTEENGKYTLALEPIVGSLSVKLASGIITDRAGNENEEIERSFVITSKSDETLYAYTSLSPNPNNGRFKVDFPWATQGNKTIQVIDMLGRTILEKKTNETSTEINLKNQENGSYILRIISDSGIATKLFVKQ